jgi:hypothetical protein
VRLDLATNPANAHFGMGLGKGGGLLSNWLGGAPSVTWRWDGNNGNNGVWLGSTKAGLRMQVSEPTGRTLWLLLTDGP